jgi:hypothetical protein
MNGWNQDPLYPNSTGNKISIPFKNINPDKFDVCLNLSVLTNTTVDLKIDYEFWKSKSDNLMEFSINENTNIIDFCIGDFIYSIQDNFRILISITNAHDSKWIESTFTLKNYVARLQPRITSSLNLVKDWEMLDRTKTSEYPLAKKEFIPYPKEAFDESYNEGEKYYIKFPGKFNNKIK